VSPTLTPGGSGKHADFDPFDSHPRLKKEFLLAKTPVETPARFIERVLIRAQINFIACFLTF
jgi:hypothetical protein